MNEIVKYNNYMNELKFGKFTPVDLNMLMALCAKAKNKGTSEIILSFDEIRDMIDYKSTSIPRFVSNLERMNEQLMKVTCKIKTGKQTLMFVLFPTFLVDEETATLTVSVNEKFRFILNELSQFTRFELTEFISLDGKYAKNLYRLLKQYRTSGWYEVDTEKFRDIIGIPKSYSNKYIMDKAIKPAIEEISNKGFIKNLICEPKKAKRRGSPVIGYKFTFEPETTPESDQIDGQMNITDFPEALPDKPAKKSSFNNLESRKYDYDELEKQLLDKK